MVAVQERAIPSRLRRAYLLLHIFFWLTAVSLGLLILFTQVYEKRDMPPLVNAVFLATVLGLFVGRGGFYVSLWRLVSGVGGRPIMWVGGCILLWPFVDIAAYVSMTQRAKEWLRPTTD